MGPALTVSVIICAYTMDRWAELVEAVRSLLRQTHPPEEVIVVVDGNDTLFERARAELPDARVLLNQDTPGASGGRNTGVKHARGAIVAFIDDDAFAEPDWLKHLLTAYEDPRTLGAGGGIVPLWREGRPAWFPDEFNWVVGCSYPGLPKTPEPVRNPIGTNLSMWREVFETNGGFHPAFARVTPPGGAIGTGTADETEFCIRASRARPGGRWIYVPDARVHHVVPSSRATWSYFVGRCRMEGASKALLSELAGAGAGLASERRYVRSVLPRALARELGRALIGMDRAALRRAGSIVAGCALTATAYFRARAIATVGRRRNPLVASSSGPGRH